MEQPAKFLGMGARGKVIDFTDSYTEKFLYEHGLKRYELDSMLIKQYLNTIQTKYGELVVDLSDVVTYVGHGIWSVSKDE